MNETREYNRAELDLLPPFFILELMSNSSDCFEECGGDVYDLINRCGRNSGGTLWIDCRAYSVAVVEHNKNTQEVVDLVKYNSQFNTFSFYKKNLKIGGWDTLHTMYHTTNPFQGLTNPDGTQRKSCTREELEAWKRGEVV